jgi:superfamily I DNA/RNA helicase
LQECNAERFDDPDWTFDDAQRQAVVHGDGPLQIVAGPGSGKTEVLVSRTLKLLLVDAVDPASVMVTTFTQKAAQSLEERIVDRLSQLGYAEVVDTNELRIGTLHSLCNDLMGEFRYSGYTNVELLDDAGQQMFTYDNCDFVDVLRGNADDENWDSVDAVPDDAWRTFEDILPNSVSQNYGPNKWEATDAATTLFDRISQYDTDIDALAEHENPNWRLCAEGLRRYRETLREKSRCDFARVLEQFVSFLHSPASDRLVEGDSRTPGLKHVLVDEYQDTNPLQERLYFELLDAIGQPNVTVVGDDDQALYRFRGGTVECLIQFTERVEDRFDTTVHTEQLQTNYRSTVDIVEWCNRYVGDHLRMNDPGARAPGKEPMDPNRTGTGDETSVRSLVTGDDDAAAADAAARVVDRIVSEGYVDDYSQVAFLFRSTKETDDWAGPYVEALRDHDIPVHNPRNKSFLDREEIQLFLGAVVRCLDPELEILESIRGRRNGQINSWVDTYDEYVADGGASGLRSYVERFQERLEAADTRDSLGRSLLGLTYQLLSFDPLCEWVETEAELMRGRRLAHVSKLFDQFERVNGPFRLRRDSETLSVYRWPLREFYNQFCGYLTASDFDDPENPHEQTPEGKVQVMTTHQAKGLEFPVVFTSDLDSDPWQSGTYWLEDQLEQYASINPVGGRDARAARDEIRRFYVSYSRAEEDLVLLDQENAPGELSLGYEDGTALTTDWFEADRRVNPTAGSDQFDGDVQPISGVDLKRRYSITGDVLSFRRCKRQYGYYNEREFAPNHVTQLFFGQVVHETLDRAHRHFAGELEGATGGEVPSDDDIERYFNEVAEALKARNLYPMSSDAEETALTYVQRFNRREGDALYPRVEDTECALQSNREEFVLEGVVDVLAGDDDAVEIWDYKAGQRPDEPSELGDYTAQLRTYAELYRYSEGEYPDRGVIYFLGEDDRETAIFELEYDETDVEDALASFEQTVHDIETARETDDWFQVDDPPSEATCNECDVRWSCPARTEYELDD